VDNLTELLLETDTPVRLIVADINRDGTREVLDEDAPPRFDVEVHCGSSWRSTRSWTLN